MEDNFTLFKKYLSYPCRNLGNCQPEKEICECMFYYSTMPPNHCKLCNGPRWFKRKPCASCAYIKHADASDSNKETEEEEEEEECYSDSEDEEIEYWQEYADNEYDLVVLASRDNLQKLVDDEGNISYRKVNVHTQKGFSEIDYNQWMHTAPTPPPLDQQYID